MEKKTIRYLKVVMITVAAVLIVLGAGMGVIYDKDRIGFDIQKLKQSVGIANAMNLKVSFADGYIVLNRAGSFDGPKIEIPTLENVEVKEESVELEFKSIFFKETLTIQNSSPLDNAPEENLPGRIDQM